MTRTHRTADNSVFADGRINDPDAVANAARESMVVHVKAMLGFHAMGIPTFDYGNNLREFAKQGGEKNV